MTSTQSLTLKGNKTEVMQTVENYMKDLGFKIISKDAERPWGGFLVLDESQAEKFAAMFFPNIEMQSLRIAGGKLSPKILIVQAQKRLSWQYHHRRAEIWKLVAGTAGVVTSETDQHGPLKQLSLNEIIKLHQGIRHRLVGMDNWGMIAEIWQHTDPAKPSDENDIVRVQDDFGR